MKALILDTGALIALEDNNRKVWEMIKIAVDEDAFVGVPAGVLAQVYRDGARQANLMRALKSCEDLVLDGVTARVVGSLCAEAQVSDVVDGSVAVEAAKLARSHDTVILTSDPGDIEVLLGCISTEARLVSV